MQLWHYHIIFLIICHLLLLIIIINYFFQLLLLLLIVTVSTVGTIIVIIIIISESISKTFRCKHCPYFGTDEVLFKYHEEMHVGHRQYSCNLCTYSSLCSISLHRHLNLHFPSLPSRSTAKNKLVFNLTSNFFSYKLLWKVK